MNNEVLKSSIISQVVSNLLGMMVNEDAKKAQKAFKTLLNAYNSWQESECSSVDYIFNLDNNDDLICCINGGLTAQEISHLVYGDRNFGMSRFFFFGENHLKPQQLSMEELVTILSVNAPEYIKFILKRGFSGGVNDEEMAYIYNNYISVLFND